jgi:D-3-phosphoglycerate dehydrogenase
MISKPLVVYPDADHGESSRHSAAFLRLETFCDFKEFTGNPVSEEEYSDRLEGARGILLGWSIPSPVLALTKQLEVVSFTGIGVGKFVDLKLAAQKGITVCNCPGYSDTTVAEHTMGLLLSSVKHITRLDRQLRTGIWNQDYEAMELRGKSIGLVGFGGIAKNISRLCLAFGLRVKVWTRSRDNGFDDDYGVEFCTLEELYRECDIISLHVASSSETSKIIDELAFSKMKKGVVFINTARAELVDESSLLDALESGKIGFAALDVYHQEPLPASSVLMEMQNVTLSPHVAYNTPEATLQLFDIAVSNLENYFAGRPCNAVPIS